MIFLLVLQTEFQKDVVTRYGNKVILTDATHGTTQYDFQLISTVVIDDYGEGLPVAWAISNREDVALVQFLKAVHAQVGRCQSVPSSILMHGVVYSVVTTQKIIVYLAC